MTYSNQTQQLGYYLLNDGYITKEELDAALEEQIRCGCKLGKILVGKGYVNHLNLYQALAKHFKVEFVNLIQSPPSVDLLLVEDKQDYVRLGLVPWKKEGDTLIVAVTDINPGVVDWIAQHYGQNYRFVMTSPFDVIKTIQGHFADMDDWEAREALQQHLPESSAKTLLATNSQRMIGGLLVVLPFILCVSSLGLWCVFMVINFFYLALQMFKAVLCVTGGSRPYAERQSEALEEKDLPIYTILVPLFQEETVLKQLVQAIRSIDYPKSKLDVKLIVESQDRGTIEAIKALHCERYFEIIEVPYSLPQTKPKACNYALRFAKGEYVTIYDAEDIPDPQQLKSVIQVFRSSPQDVACIQARLNYYNRKENLLTQLFSIEYSIWFDFMLPGLAKLGMPIPLGGTSNHIKTDVLKKLYAWDPYNVTEDADLGVRLQIQGYRTCVVDSLTLEEAPISLGNWIKQRTRWIKGYMQTYLVHMRRPVCLLRVLGLRGFVGFQLFVGAPCLIFVISPLMWGLWLWIIADGGTGIFPPWFHWVAVVNLVLGMILQIGMGIMVVMKHKWWDIALSVLIFPCYWILHSIASFRAVKQLMVNPSYWEKTPHGVSAYIR